MKIFAYVLTVSCLLVAGSALAMERWDFGRIPYGSKVSEKPSFAQSWDCPPDDGCTFKDDLGVEYQTWEWDQIVTKEFVVTPENHHLIPFGINYDGDVQSVLRTIKMKTGKTLKCYDNKEIEHLLPGELFCSAEVLDSVILCARFGSNGKLTDIAIWTHFV